MCLSAGHFEPQELVNVPIHQIVNFINITLNFEGTVNLKQMDCPFFGERKRKSFMMVETKV